jgi:uncharacterized protein YkwD
LNRARLLAVCGIFAIAQAAQADVSDSVNWARQHGCTGGATRAALQSNSKLQKAVARLAAGSALHDALAAVAYTASESFALHISGASSDSQIAAQLTAHYCRTLIEPTLREIGVERRGSELWILLAAPVAIPAAADAVSVSRRILDLVNTARAAGRHCGNRYFPPVATLSLNSSLTGAALAHSREMAAYGVFDHRGRDGSTPSARVKRAGYGPYRIVGENIAEGAMTPAEVTSGWLASPPHCENIMDGRFTQIGIAYAANPAAAAVMYWTQDFAAPR